uniref:Myelin protein zero-like 1 like n=1 Tax=Takifugu rubripes TaxID=31033 RepID=H2TE27_TAKRU
MLTKLLMLTTLPSSAIHIHADSEVIVQNGTTGILRCTFKSSEVVSSATSVTWSFQSIFRGIQGFLGQPEFQDRVQFIGDINKRDVSIQLSPAQFTDNGTFFCDVKNPPDVTGTPARTELRVVLKESLPQPNTAVIVGSVCAGLFLLVVIAAAGPVIYAQLDHSGSKNSFHKNEPVVYADIRKN